MTDCMSRFPRIYRILHHCFRTALALHFPPQVIKQYKGETGFQKPLPEFVSSLTDSKDCTSVKSLPAQKSVIDTTARMISSPCQDCTATATLPPSTAVPHRSLLSYYMNATRSKREPMKLTHLFLCSSEHPPLWLQEVSRKEL